MLEYVIEENDSGRRIDRLLRRFLPCAPLSLIYSSIRKGLVRLNGKKVKAENKTSLGDVLYLAESLESFKKEKITGYQKLHLNIILKTRDLLFINKKAGEITHGKGSVDEKVKKSFRIDSSLSFSVGALHRLDKETTGVLSFSQSLKGASLFSKALIDGQIERYYIGINEGRIKEGLLKLSSRDSKGEEKLELTHSVLLEYSKKDELSLSFYCLITGRKHQIRRASQYFNTPLFCDDTYGSKRKDHPTYFLHSICLHFLKPIFNDVPSFVVASIPTDFYNIIKMCFPLIHKKLKSDSLENVLREWIRLF